MRTRIEGEERTRMIQDRGAKSVVVVHVTKIPPGKSIPRRAEKGPDQEPQTIKRMLESHAGAA
jgi:hypothetical protein